MLNREACYLNMPKVVRDKGYELIELIDLLLLPGSHVLDAATPLLGGDLLTLLYDKP
jgi:hypothetical protein